MDMKKEFKSNTGYLVGFCLLVWFALGMGLTALAVEGSELYTSLTRAEAGIAYYVASISTAILTSAMAPLLVAGACRITVSVGPEEILFSSGFRIPRRIPLKGNVFSTNIQSFYGLGILPTRFLTVTTNGVPRAYWCCCFTGDTFDQMMAAVQEAAVNANRFK